jgi:hypothetical protein
VAELNVLVLLPIPALNPLRVSEVVNARAATAASEATSASLLLPMRLIMVLE